MTSCTSLRSDKKGSHSGLPLHELSLLSFATGLVASLGYCFGSPQVDNLYTTIFLPP